MKNNTRKNQEPQSVFNNGNELLTRLCMDYPRGPQKGEFAICHMRDDSLKEYGINDNDCVIVQKTTEYDENQLTAWVLVGPQNKSGLIGFAYDNFGDISIQLSLGIQRFKRRKIKLKGVVVGIVRCVSPKQEDTGTTDEITAVCDQCKKQLTATREFIKAQGWKLKENETICLHCDLKD